MNDGQSVIIDGTAKIPFAPGRFSGLWYSHQRLTVAGWMFLPGHRLEAYRLKVNGVKLPGDRAPLAESAVEKRLPMYPEAGSSVFVLREPIPQQTFDDWAMVEVCGLASGSEKCRITMLYRLDCQESLPD